MFAICLMCGIGILVNCGIALFTKKERVKDIACIISSIFAAFCRYEITGITSRNFNTYSSRA